MARIREPDHSRITGKLLALEREPRPLGTMPVRHTPYHRIRVGDWRILYQIFEARRVVVVALVLRRNEQTYAGLS